MVQWERSPSTKEAWVRILDTVSYLKCVKLVVGSHLAPKVFLQVLRYFFLHKTNTSKFQFDLETVDKESVREVHYCKVVFID